MISFASPCIKQIQNFFNSSEYYISDGFLRKLLCFIRYKRRSAVKKLLIFQNKAEDRRVVAVHVDCVSTGILFNANVLFGHMKTILNISKSYPL